MSVHFRFKTPTIMPLLSQLTRKVNRSQYRQCFGRFNLRNIQEQVTPEVLQQRLRRPLSPHMTIYQPQLTWVMSIGHRITGAGLAAMVYAFGIGFAVAEPKNFTEVAVKEVSQLPGPLVTGAKFILSTPFFYHALNGVRHLVWDAGYSLTLRNSYIGGWLVNIGAVAGGIAMSCFK